MKVLTKKLYIVSTPIGNLDDITIRAIEVLKKSDIILCEDTRHSIKLLNHLNIKKKLIPYHKFNEKKQITNIIKHLNEGKILSLVSDAGTPLLSDPGRLLLNECIKKKIEVVPIPGVSSITAAISVSGFNDQFLFYGFLPKKESALEKVLMSLGNIKFSIVFFIQGNKLNFYIKKFQKFFSGREILIAKEISKVHEKLYRQNINQLKTFENPVKGEFTVVVSELKNVENILNKEEIVNKAKKHLKKYSLKDTVDLIIKTENLKRLKKKDIYELCLQVKNEKIF